MENVKLRRVSFYLALQQKDYLARVRFLLSEMEAAGNPDFMRFKILFEESDNFYRYDAPILEIAAVLGITEEQLDELFTIGQQIQQSLDNQGE